MIYSPVSGKGLAPGEYLRQFWLKNANFHRGLGVTPETAHHMSST